MIVEAIKDINRKYVYMHWKKDQHVTIHFYYCLAGMVVWNTGIQLYHKLISKDECD